MLNKIEKALGKSKKGHPAKFISNAGVKKFLTKDKQATVTLDPEKINKAAQWDGLHGVITNMANDAADWGI